MGYGIRNRTVTQPARIAFLRRLNIPLKRATKPSGTVMLFGKLFKAAECFLFCEIMIVLMR